jgi:hypothetical protein
MTPNVGLPAIVKRTGKRQLSISLEEQDFERVEAYRRARGLRSWNEAIQALIRAGLLERVFAIIEHAECCEPEICGPPEKHRCPVCQIRVLLEEDRIAAALERGAVHLPTPRQA